MLKCNPRDFKDGEENVTEKKTGKVVGLRLKIRLPNGSIGPGKIKLLELIEQEGSISAAARCLGLTYRRAWHLLDTLNSALAHPVVNASPGGKSGGGAELTELGHRIVTLYREAEEKAHEETGSLFDFLKGEVVEAEKKN